MDLRSIEERLRAKLVVAPSGCWEWSGSRTAKGYGKVRVGSARDGSRKMEGTHRVAYELWVGPIPEDELVRHSCDNPPCCNPDHLLAGSSRDNQQDAIARQRRRPPPSARSNSAKTLCIHGHSLDLVRKDGSRRCSTCNRARALAWYRQNRAK